MRFLDKNTAIATVAGVLLGSSVIGGVFLLFLIWRSPILDGFSLSVGVMCLGIFTIATSKEKIEATVISSSISLVVAYELTAYLLGDPYEGLGMIVFYLLIEFMIVLPLTAFSAWLGARVRRWRSADSV